MARSPRFKVHDTAGAYVASCKRLEHAILLARCEGGSVRDALGVRGQRTIFKTPGTATSSSAIALDSAKIAAKMIINRARWAEFCGYVVADQE